MPSRLPCFGSSSSSGSSTRSCNATGNRRELHSVPRTHHLPVVPGRARQGPKRTRRMMPATWAAFACLDRQTASGEASMGSTVAPRECRAGKLSKTAVTHDSTAVVRGMRKGVPREGIHGRQLRSAASQDLSPVCAHGWIRISTWPVDDAPSSSAKAATSRSCTIL